MEHVDVLITGAGLSGIASGARISRAFPERSYVILEQREESGGTWSLFKYPGIRSDSDMFTFGMNIYPWHGKWAIAEGADILKYIRSAAKKFKVEDKIRYQRKVVAASWSSEQKQWTVTVEHVDTGETSQITADYYISASGYYDYDNPYRPEFPGEEDFAGDIIHPQHWPEDYDYAGKRVIVIGSGATAMTLVPSMAKDAEHITMLQRTPTYVMAQPRIHPFAKLARRALGKKVADRFIKEAYAAGTVGLYVGSKLSPNLARKVLKKWAQEKLPDDFDYDTHFTPPYDPWDQRLCVVPGGDLFKSIRSGKVDIVTDHIETFTKKGILLKSGTELEADIIITATGLTVLPFGGIDLTVDGEQINIGDLYTYRAMMFSNVPNFAFMIGYSNASWTLKIDLALDYLIRLFEYMDERGYTVATPTPEGELSEAPLWSLTSGYLQRARHKLPKSGDREPWKIKDNYHLDRIELGMSKVDEEMVFS